MVHHENERNFVTCNQGAFRIGSQGPDPLFFYSLILKRGLHPKIAKQKLGSQMHHLDGTLLFSKFIEQADGLEEESEREVLSSFIMGQLAHFLLDSTAHPYVYYWSGFDASGHLSGHYHYRHAHFEGQIDATLAYNRGRQELIGHPQQVLTIDDETLHLISASFVTVMERMFSMSLPNNMYYDALKDMSDFYCFANSGAAWKRKFFGKSAIGQIYLPRTPYKEVLNDSHQIWLEPSTGIKRNDSFGELYSKAAARLENCYQRSVKTGLRYEYFSKVMPNTNYNGYALGAKMIYQDKTKRFVK